MLSGKQQTILRLHFCRKMLQATFALTQPQTPLPCPGVTSSPPQRYWYGTSLSTVREVAATGRLCVTKLDLLGARALRADPRIDGLYVYVTTSSPEVGKGRWLSRTCRSSQHLGRWGASRRNALFWAGLSAGLAAHARRSRNRGALYLGLPAWQQVLEQRQRARLKEAESTLAKRITWARAQCARATAFDHVVANGDDIEEVREH